MDTFKLGNGGNLSDIKGPLWSDEKDEKFWGVLIDARIVVWKMIDDWKLRNRQGSEDTMSIELGAAAIKELAEQLAQKERRGEINKTVLHRLDEYIAGQEAPDKRDVEVHSVVLAALKVLIPETRK